MNEDIKNMCAIFTSRGFIVKYFDTAKEASAYVQNQLEGLSVGMGGSITIEQMGLYESLKKTNEVFWHFYGDVSALPKAETAQAYISSVNAITKTGEIINIDGRGNRVSCCMHGANRKKLIYVCGINKVTEDMPSGLWRAKNVAAPKNAQRLGRKTPCALKADKCYDCKSPERICRTTVIQKFPTSVETHIVLIGEELGY